MEIMLPPMIKNWDSIPYWKRHGVNPIGKSPVKERNLKILQMRLRGDTFQSIAEHFKISNQRVQQVYYNTIMAFWAAMERENAKYESFLKYKIGQ